MDPTIVQLGSPSLPPFMKYAYNYSCLSYLQLENNVFQLNGAIQLKAVCIENQRTAAGIRQGLVHVGCTSFPRFETRVLRVLLWAAITYHQCVGA